MMQRRSESIYYVKWFTILQFLQFHHPDPWFLQYEWATVIRSIMFKYCIQSVQSVQIDEDKLKSHRLLISSSYISTLASIAILVLFRESKALIMNKCDLDSEWQLGVSNSCGMCVCVDPGR